MSKEIAISILSKHWLKRTGKEIDETVLEHLSYTIDAMQEFSDQNTKQLIDEITELKAKLESKTDESNEYAAQCNKYHDLYLSKDGENKHLQSDLKAAESVNEGLYNVLRNAKLAIDKDLFPITYKDLDNQMNIINTNPI